MSKKLLHHFESKQQTIEERIDAGKALRKKCTRLSLGTYHTPAKRVDPVALLEKQGKSRVQELVPIRYARMLTSPFAFLRGSAAIMAGDIAASGKHSGLMVQACGDMHVANFGVFSSAERNLIFGINDFDETLPAPFEWDLKRLVTSIVASGQFLGADKKLCEEAIRTAVSTYRKKMKQYAQMGNLELWYSTIKEKDVLGALDPSARAGAEKIMAKARTRTHMQVLGKLTDIIDEKYLLREDAPFIVRVTHMENGQPIREGINLFLESYFASLADDRASLLKHYRITDVVRKVVGVGSVGTRCFVIFLTGNHTDDPLFLQFKEAEPSALAPFAPKSKYSNEGQRVVSGQRLIQGAPDIFLGWGEIKHKHFYIRQLRDMKGGIEFDPTKVKVQNLPQYTSLCAWALALAHAKSGDAAMLAGYVGNSEELDDAMVKFAFSYALQNEKDYAALVKAAKAGKIKVGRAE
jgi:uncharacterized protein (DUF2252 family)